MHRDAHYASHSPSQGKQHQTARPRKNLLTRFPISELKLECELDRARAADLVQRIEAAALATAAEVVVQHLRGLTELRRGQVVDRAAEVRLIEDVEEIASELKRKSFCEAELAAHVMSHCLAPKPRSALRPGTRP